MINDYDLIKPESLYAKQSNIFLDEVHFNKRATGKSILINNYYNKRAILASGPTKNFLFEN